MNMLSLNTFLLIFCCLTFMSSNGKPQDLIPPCEGSLMVWRGTVWKAAPRQKLTVSCPVKHCGESLNVTWCKLLSKNKCQWLNNANNVEITQNYSDVKELTSYLTFKCISTHDDGLYRCDVKGYNYKLISHTINISVSDINHGVKNSTALKNYYNSADDESPSMDGDNEAMFWLPYFTIFVSIALLVITLTVFTFLSFYGLKQILTYNLTRAKEMSTHMLPGFSKGSAPSTSDLHYSPTTAGTPLSLTTNGHQPAVAHTADESQVSDKAVYAVINHRQAGMPAREQRTLTAQDKNSAYAAISVS